RSGCRPARRPSPPSPAPAPRSSRPRAPAWAQPGGTCPPAANLRSRRASSAEPPRTVVRLTPGRGLARRALRQRRHADRATADGANGAIAGDPPVDRTIGVVTAQRRANLVGQFRRGGADQIADALIVGGAGEAEVAGIAPGPRRSVARDRGRQADVAEATACR